MRARHVALMLIAFLACGFLVVRVDAKGIVKTKDDSSSQSQDSGEQRSSPPPKQQDSPPSSSQDSRSSSGNSVGNSRSEQRDSTTSEDTSRSSSERGERDSSSSLSRQVERRDERRDPEYEYRKHYYDPFFYPYDRQFWSYYPYYNRGSVIIIDDAWRNPRRAWRREYSYRSPVPGSLEEALVDIEATWWEREPEFLMWHVDPARSIDIFYQGDYSHRVSPREMYKLTEESLSRIRTTEFRFTSVERDGYEARAAAKHVFDGPDGKRRTTRLVYYLSRERNRWIITQLDFSKTDYGSPKCFIATAAYGTDMEEDVLTLRQFRDRYLMTSPAGRDLVNAYYEISPPIADGIRESKAARAVIRSLLLPIVQTCKVLVGD
ncbi:MAG: hypothetical protein KBC96_10500 [Armatimonadetes bacterium]|nr:hypothetical protein [Armatimonadota bacterium]